MKKLLIIIPIVIVVAAATVLGLFATGVLGKKDEPVAYAVEASKSEPGVFKGLGVDAAFKVKADKQLGDKNIGNYVSIHNSKGDPVDLSVKKVEGEEGVYSVKASYGFKPRSSYQIWVKLNAAFVEEQYAGLKTFIFMTGGEEKEVVAIRDVVKETSLAGTVVEPDVVGEETYYNIVLAEAAEQRYQPGDVILAKKPAEGIFSDELAPLYTGDIPGYAYNGMAAYYVLRTSEVVDGKEEIYCRLAEINEVVSELDIYKTLQINEDNFSVNEELLQQALENSEFTAAV